MTSSPQHPRSLNSSSSDPAHIYTSPPLEDHICLSTSFSLLSPRTLWQLPHAKPLRTFQQLGPGSYVELGLYQLHSIYADGDPAYGIHNAAAEIVVSVWDAATNSFEAVVLERVAPPGVQLKSPRELPPSPISRRDQAGVVLRAHIDSSGEQSSAPIKPPTYHPPLPPKPASLQSRPAASPPPPPVKLPPTPPPHVLENVSRASSVSPPRPTELPVMSMPTPEKDRDVAESLADISSLSESQYSNISAGDGSDGESDRWSVLSTGPVDRQWTVVFEEKEETV